MGGFRLFTLAGIPVWVSPWFLLLLLWFVQGGNLQRGLVLSGCILVSIVAHEFGHALVAKGFRLAPQIMVHGMGGHTFMGGQRAPSAGADALIVAAGPFAGLVLGSACAAVLFFLLPGEQRSLSMLWQLASAGMYLRDVPVAVQALGALVSMNIFWSVLNLLPVYPLDGGLLLRLGMLKLLGKPLPAERVTYAIGLLGVAALGFVTYRLHSTSTFNWIILGWIALRNIQGLTTAAPTQPARRDNPFARELLNQAERAYQHGDDEEAARLCHQIRAETSVPPAVLARTWAMLGVIATRKGEFGEALSYLRRAPDGADVVEATAQCFYQLEMYEALRALTETKAFGRLPTETREQILGALRQSPV
jgi:Zn-dependent protease